MAAFGPGSLSKVEESLLDMSDTKRIPCDTGALFRKNYGWTRLTPRSISEFFMGLWGFLRTGRAWGCIAVIHNEEIGDSTTGGTSREMALFGVQRHYRFLSRNCVYKLILHPLFTHFLGF